MLQTAGPPGTTKPRRVMPRLHYELIVCGLRGHELVGTDAARVRPEDAVLVREDGEGLRWHRCLRCDSWLPLPHPEHPAHDVPPSIREIEIPARGRALRDKIVLRLIAVDRALHFVVLSLLAAAIFVLAANEARLRGQVYKVLADIQGGVGGPQHDTGHGLLHDIHRLFSLNEGTLRTVGVVVLAYALLEGAEAVGLWLQRRWAEYLTFVATTVLLPLEVYELAQRPSPLKVITLVINVAVVVYLLFAKRLFGLRGGAAAEEAERRADAGWEALVRTAPGRAGVPATT